MSWHIYQDVSGAHTIHRQRTRLARLLSRRVEVHRLRTSTKSRGVEVEELGVSQEVQALVAKVKVLLLGGQLVLRRNGVEVGQVLRHVWCATPIKVGHYRGAVSKVTVLRRSIETVRYRAVGSFERPIVAAAAR